MLGPIAYSYSGEGNERAQMLGEALGAVVGMLRIEFVDALPLHAPICSHRAPTLFSADPQPPQIADSSRFPI